MAGAKRSISDFEDSLESKKVRRLDTCFGIDYHRLERAQCPKFRKPQEVATFSVTVKTDQQQSVSCDPSVESTSDEPNVSKYSVAGACARTLCKDVNFNHMRLVIPWSLNHVNFDLNKGYGSHTKKESENEFMDILLHCLLQENLSNKSEFVCWRGLLTKVAASPYDAGGKFDDGLKIVAQKFCDVIYLHEFPTEQALKKQEHLDDRQKLMQYWGMKFESYLTAKSGEKPDIEEQLNLNNEFGVVVSSKLGSHSIMFGGEVDCSLSSHNKYVELKTTREFSHEGHRRSFRKFKLMKWWLQSFLIGIEDIFYGLRNDEGFVKQCKWLKVSDIPQIIKQDRDSWRPGLCLTFLDEFLTFVKESVTESLVPHVFTRSPGAKEFRMVVDRKGENKFLPRWFVEKQSASECLQT